MTLLTANKRASGALMGVAIGDAMGMPSQTWSRDQIKRVYGEIVDFMDAAADHPVSGGLRAGTITDDTEQSLLLAQHLIERHGCIDQMKWAEALLAWERDTHARGVNDLLGPSTKRAIEALQRGVPVSEAGRHGTTNGAAMRIIPLGIAVPAEPLSGLIEAVEETCRLTHHTSEAIGAASAVAAVVSAGVSGADFEEAIPLAIRAAQEGEARGTPSVSGSISQRIEDALDLAKGARERVAETIGTSVAAIESVPMAFAVVRLANGDPWQAAVISANVGDDTDTIGAISCGMAGACNGIDAFPAAKREQVCRANALNLESIVAGLLGLRRAQAAS